MGCSKKDNSSDNTADNKDKPKSDSAIVYETGEFLITPQTIGNARLGQTIKDFKETFKDYQIKTVPVWNYCVDGGGDGLLVSRNKEELIFVWTMQGSDSIHEIVVMSDKFRTKDGVKPHMTVGQLLKHYPDMSVYLNLLCEGEFFWDKKNKMTFDFLSNDSTTVGLYKVAGDESKPVDTTKRVTRISISKNSD
jgi:hypothetical protein